MYMKVPEVAKYHQVSPSTGGSCSYSDLCTHRGGLQAGSEAIGRFAVRRWPPRACALARLRLAALWSILHQSWECTVQCMRGARLQSTERYMAFALDSRALRLRDRRPGAVLHTL